MRTTADSRQLVLPWLSPVNLCSNHATDARRKETAKQLRRGVQGLPETSLAVLLAVVLRCAGDGKSAPVNFPCSFTSASSGDSLSARRFNQAASQTPGVCLSPGLAMLCPIGRILNSSWSYRVKATKKKEDRDVQSSDFIRSHQLDLISNFTISPPP